MSAYTESDLFEKLNPKISMRKAFTNFMYKLSLL